MKILTWNINALGPTVRNAVLKHGSWQGFFQEHGIDILCVQESKVIDDKLTKDLVCVEGYQSFWAISREKKGYSGVTTYASAAFAPLGCEVDCLGHGADEAELDREGRVVVTDHGMFVLVNVYVPNAGDRPDRSRLPFKLRFLAALKRKCDALVVSGREVMIVGDFNIPAEPRDIHPALGPYNELYSTEEQAALGELTDAYTDVWRRLHPEESATFTVWNEKTSARAFNQGLRIDYVLCTPGLLGHVVSCEVLPAEVLPPKWSDHAGILLELRDMQPPAPHPPCQHWQRMHRRFNPPNRIANLFAAGKKRQAGGGASSSSAQAAEPAAAAGAAAEREGVHRGVSGAHPPSSSEQYEAEQDEAAPNKKARTAEVPSPAGAQAAAAAVGQQAGSQEGAAEQTEQQQQQQQQQQQSQRRQGAGGGSGKRRNHASSGGKSKPARQQQQPVPGQRTLGSFFASGK